MKNIKVKHPKTSGYDREQRDYEIQMIEAALDMLPANDMFDLCKQISEATLPATNELYQFFHNDENRVALDSSEPEDENK